MSEPLPHYEAMEVLHPYSPNSETQQHLEQARQDIYDLGATTYHYLTGDGQTEAIKNFMDEWRIDYDTSTDTITTWHLDPDTGERQEEYSLDLIGYMKPENQKLTGHLKIPEHLHITKLNCSDNRLTSLDVSGNPALEVLKCARNQLSGLDVSSNLALEELWCQDNRLISLDVRGNPRLKKLFCSDNQLASLYMSGSLELLTAECMRNQLLSLNVRGNPELRDFNCRHNKLTEANKQAILEQIPKAWV